MATNTDPNQGQPQEPSSEPSTETKNTEAQMVPRSRLNEEIEKRKEFQAQIDALTAAEEKRTAEAETAKKKQLEEQNKFKELYETAEAEKATANQTLESLTAQVEMMTKALTAQWEAQKELIPETFLSLVEAMPIEQRTEWLAENKEKLSAKDKGNGTPRQTQRKGITPPSEVNSGSREPAFKF